MKIFYVSDSYPCYDFWHIVDSKRSGLSVLCGETMEGRAMVGQKDMQFQGDDVCETCKSIALMPPKNPLQAIRELASPISPSDAVQQARDQNDSRQGWVTGILNDALVRAELNHAHSVTVSLESELGIGPIENALNNFRAAGWECKREPASCGVIRVTINRRL